MVIDIIKLAACICSKDGIISGDEINYMKKGINDIDPSFDINNFEDIIEDFFTENKSVEEYCEKLQKPVNKEIILEYCYESASVDGLDPRENEAYIAARKYLEKN